MITLCTCASRSKIGTKLLRILKWNAGVNIFRRVLHLSPVLEWLMHLHLNSHTYLVSRPVPSHGSRMSYWFAFVSWVLLSRIIYKTMTYSWRMSVHTYFDCFRSTKQNDWYRSDPHTSNTMRCILSTPFFYLIGKFWKMSLTIDSFKHTLTYPNYSTWTDRCIRVWVLHAVRVFDRFRRSIDDDIE